MILNEFLHHTQQQLVGSSDTPRLDAELLVLQVLQRPRSFVYSHPEYPLTPLEEQDCNVLVARRRQGEPIAYILGQREFWSLSLRVSPAVLIPRPETELLVETALRLLPQDLPQRLADLGTGSGAIALALATERPHWTVDATDQSAAALAIAQHNQQQHALKNVQFWPGSWCDALPRETRYHAILSNPPYLDATDPHLHQGDVRFEPRQALVAAQQGLADVQTIITQARDYLSPNGWLLLEHGYQQAANVRALMSNAGYHAVQSVRDLAGIERITIAQKILDNPSQTHYNRTI